MSAPRDDPDVATALTARRIVLDCRWLGLPAGVGRVTELLLASLRDGPPPGDWILWGESETLEPFLFAGAVVAPAKRDPRAWLGQRDALRVPDGDVVVYLHQIRPLRPGRSVTVVHDTIGLRHGAGRAARFAKRALFAVTARLSTQVLTDSDFSRDRITEDLRVPRERIAVMRFPVDVERAAAIARLRDSLGQEDRLLYVGRFVSHKNLDRLCLAFRDSRFAARGGTLTLVGGWEGEVDALGSRLDAAGITGVDLRDACTAEELDRLMATSRALVLPSLEEGYGLPAFEAAASGLPVAASRTGAMTDLPPERAVLFDPLDVHAIRAAIDEATSRPAGPPATDPGTGFREVVLGAIARALAGSS